jgi:hypothetical protein
MDAVERRFRIARFVEAVGCRMFLVGLLGYAGGFVSARFSGITGREQSVSALGQFLVWLFFALSVGGLLVVLPFSSLLYRRARRLSPSGGVDELDPRSPAERAELPAWFGWPLWAFVGAAALWLTYLLVRYGIPAYLSNGK